MRLIALSALIPASATVYFFIFWRGFDYWRKHRVATYSLMFGVIGGGGVAVGIFRDQLLAARLDLPPPIQWIGWALIASSIVFGTIADRQIGLRVRSFMPFFDENGRIELKTGGAYGIVRHPIYASGIWYQLGAFLATGHLAIVAACAIFTLGALWFTRQEERRLVDLLEDPSEYQRYRERVPRLFPRLKR